MEDDQERELKFSSVELDELRRRLVELEAERLRPALFEDNWIFDRDGEMASSGCLLRLRTDSHGARITYKGPVRYEEQTRVRLEHETAVDDAVQIRAVLEGLGYRVVRRYQKVREEWHLGAIVVSLDHTPIGDFVEFEGESAEAVARRCRLDPAKAERRSYLRLYDDYRKEHPEAPEDMVFPP
jgi:adenylate cyclase class 2